MASVSLLDVQKLCKRGLQIHRGNPVFFVYQDKIRISNGCNLLKMLYLAMMDTSKKWTGWRQDWGAIHSQLEVFFADRIPSWVAGTRRPVKGEMHGLSACRP